MEKKNTNPEFTEIPLSKLVLNTGQIEGLPANPRKISSQKLENLKKNIQQNPEMLKLRGLMVYQQGDKYVVIGGNMRLRAMRELKFTTALCIIIPPHTTREKLKAYTILDNQQAGEWDWEMVQSDWTLEAFQDWGIDLPEMRWKWKTTFQRWRRTIIKLHTLRRWEQTSNEVI